MAITFSSPASSNLWDVFLSFYGKDTRRNFIANLYFALDQAGISTFRDDPALEKGEEISSGLLNAIKNSKMFVVVVSRNYARSSWCLNELVEILRCKKTKNQVIPVFYYVDPCDLQHLNGSFGEALDHHKERNYPVATIDKWKSALAEVAELSGYHLKEDANENESDTVQQIVEGLALHASTKLLHLEEYLVGIDSAVEEIYHKLRIASNDVRTISICGMGGIEYHLEGANKIKGLILNLSMSRKEQISAKIFERFPNLRLLEVISAHDITGNFENSFFELRCIRWYHCPWTCLPSSFHPQKLVLLDMPFNEFKTLWKTPKLMRSLKIIDMSYSKNLKRTLDLRDLNMVEKLCFRGSKILQEVHPSIGQLLNLRHLDMGDCNNLKELPEPIGELNELKNLELGLCINLTRLPQHIKQLTRLGSLNLSDCINLKWLPEQLGDMKGLKMLDASRTAIEQVPDSIVHLKELISLSLAGCKKLKKLPDQFGNMDGLQKFIASDSGIEEFPDSIGQLVNLAYLGLYDCKNFTDISFSLWDTKLVRLHYLDSCSKRERLREKLGNMNERHVIQELPNSVGLMSRLQVLELSRLQLKKVPNSTWDLTSLIKVHLPYDDIFTSNLPVMNQLEHLSLRCYIRLWLPTILGFSSLKVLYLCDEEKSLSSIRWISLSKLSNLEILTLDNWGSSFLDLPPNLTRLTLWNHATLEQLPDLSNLEHLEILYIKNLHQPSITSATSSES